MLSAGFTWWCWEWISSPKYEPYTGPEWLLQYEWDSVLAKPVYVLYHYTAWSNGWGISVGHKRQAQGDLNWAKKTAKHFRIEDQLK